MAPLPKDPHEIRDNASSSFRKYRDRYEKTQENKLLTYRTTASIAGISEHNCIVAQQAILDNMDANDDMAEYRLDRFEQNIDDLYRETDTIAMLKDLELPGVNSDQLVLKCIDDILQNPTLGTLAYDHIVKQGNKLERERAAKYEKIQEQVFELDVAGKVEKIRDLECELDKKETELNTYHNANLQQKQEILSLQRQCQTRIKERDRRPDISHELYQEERKNAIGEAGELARLKDQLKESLKKIEAEQKRNKQMKEELAAEREKLLEQTDKTAEVELKVKQLETEMQTVKADGEYLTERALSKTQDAGNAKAVTELFEKEKAAKEEAMKQVAALQAEKRALERDNRGYEDLKAKHTRTEADYEDSLEVIKEQADEIAVLQSKCQDYELEQARLDDARKDFERAHNDLDNERDELRQKDAETTKHYMEELDDANEKFEDAQHRVTTLREQVTQAEQAAAQHEIALQTARTEHGTATSRIESELSKLREDHGRLQTSFELERQVVQKHVNTITNLQAANNTNQVAIANKDVTIKHLEEQVATYQSQAPEVSQKMQQITRKSSLRKEELKKMIEERNEHNAMVSMLEKTVFHHGLGGSTYETFKGLPDVESMPSIDTRQIARAVDKIHEAYKHYPVARSTPLELWLRSNVDCIDVTLSTVLGAITKDMKTADIVFLRATVVNAELKSYSPNMSCALGAILQFLYNVGITYLSDHEVRNSINRIADRSTGLGKNIVEHVKMDGLLSTYLLASIPQSSERYDFKGFTLLSWEEGYIAVFKREVVWMSKGSLYTAITEDATKLIVGHVDDLIPRQEVEFDGAILERLDKLAPDMTMK